VASSTAYLLKASQRTGMQIGDYERAHYIAALRSAGLQVRPSISRRDAYVQVREALLSAELAPAVSAELKTIRERRKVEHDALREQMRLRLCREAGVHPED